MAKKAHLQLGFNERYKNKTKTKNDSCKNQNKCKEMLVLKMTIFYFNRIAMDMMLHMIIKQMHCK